MIVRWNLTGRRRNQQGAHAVILSIGKSGRTWLRVLLNKFLSLHYNVPFDIVNLSKYGPDVPSIGYSHELWKHFSGATVSERIRGKYLMTPKMLFSKRVVLLYRDPRDVVVSLYFQVTKRSNNRITSSIGDFLRHKKFGILNIIKVMNEWRERLRDHPQCIWLSYEGMRSDTAGELSRVLDFIGIKNADTEQIKEAVDFARFENMKKMEARGEFQKQSLRPGDPADADSFKVREGKVGGYKRHFSAEDLEYMEQAMMSLNGFYGYRPESRQ